MSPKGCPPKGEHPMVMQSVTLWGMSPNGCIIYVPPPPYIYIRPLMDDNHQKVYK